MCEAAAFVAILQVIVSVEVCNTLLDSPWDASEDYTMVQTGRDMIVKSMKTGLIIVVIVLFIFVTVGVHAQDAKAGKDVYTKKCQTCHGADGSGNPGIAKALNVQLKPLASDEIQTKSDADLKKTITAGVGKMKPVSGVSDKEVNDVVAYVRTLKAK
jgi:mono/diheme cytochrome c family protein